MRKVKKVIIVILIILISKIIIGIAFFGNFNPIISLISKIKIGNGSWNCSKVQCFPFSVYMKSRDYSMNDFAIDYGYELDEKKRKGHRYEVIKKETGERYSILVSDTDEYDMLYIRRIEP